MKRRAVRVSSIRVSCLLSALLAPWSPVPRFAAAGEALSEADLASRREALKSRIFEPAIIEARSFRLSFERKSSSFAIEDARTGVGWHSSLARKGFASVTLREGSRVLPVDLAEDLRIAAKEISFRGRSSAGEIPEIRFVLKVCEPLVGLEISFEIPPAAAGAVRSVRLLDGAPWVADADGGGAILPRGLGEWLAADRGPDFRRRFRRDDGPLGPEGASPEQATMAAVGLVRGPAALLMTWSDPAAEVEARRGPATAPGFPGIRGIEIAVEIPGPKGSLRLFPLGKGDWIEIAHSHRQLMAYEKRPAGLRAKIRDREGLESILGAAIVRPRIAGPGPDGSPRLLRPLDDLAATAARWKEVLGIDAALFVLDGWSAREAGEAGGSPFAAAACAGGAEGLGRFAGKLKSLGYLFGLRAPAREGLLEALPALKAGPAPDLLLFPAGPIEEGKALAAKIQEILGIAGTDGAGEDWAIGCGYIEGLLRHKVSRPAGDLVYPLFGFSYGHCARIAVRPEDAVEPGEPERLLAHLACGEVPIYALDPAGGAPPAGDPKGAAKDPRLCLARSDGGWAEGKGLSVRESFIKNTYEVLSPIAGIRYRSPLLFRRFLTDDGTVEETWFGEDLRIVVNYGEREYADEEDQFTLPRYGFWIRHPYFHAFHALRAHGVDYETPALFTVRSLEGKMYLRAEAVRIYHGFGPQKIQLGGRSFEVPRESVVKIW